MAKRQEHMDGRVIVEQGQWKRYYLTIPERDVIHLHCPGVTTVVGIKDKSGPLTQWAANCAADMMIQKRDQHVESVLASMPPEMRNRPVMIPATLIDSWYNDLRFKFRDVKRTAAEIGTLAHDYLDAHLKWVHFGQAKPDRPFVDLPNGITEDMVDLANNSIDAGLAWFDDHKIKLLATETMLVSPLYGFAGRQDFKMMVDGERCNGDFKSGSGIYDEVWLQLAAYKQMEQELDPANKIAASWAIHINKLTGEFEAIRRDDSHFDSDLFGFLGLHQVWKWSNRLEGKQDPPSGIALTPPKLKKVAKLAK
jgi:hypothetical protein